MPLYIAQSGDLDRCYRCLTDWLTDSQMKDRATQLLISIRLELSSRNIKLFRIMNVVQSLLTVHCRVKSSQPWFHYVFLVSSNVFLCRRDLRDHCPYFGQDKEWLTDMEWGDEGGPWSEDLGGSGQIPGLAKQSEDILGTSISPWEVVNGINLQNRRPRPLRPTRMHLRHPVYFLIFPVNWAL